MNWLMKKLFGKNEPPLGVYITYKRTPEQEAMFQEQRVIKDALGFEHGNDYQNWLAGASDHAGSRKAPD